MSFQISRQTVREIEGLQVMTASECILKHKLGWNVVKKPVFVDGQQVPDFVAVQREDTKSIFQIAGSKYEPIQNADAFKFFDEITKTGQAKYVQAGSFKGGAVVWLRAKLPYDFEVLPGDKMQTYLKIVTSHDGSHKLMIFPEVYRQVCSNGMHAWTRDYARTVGVKHTENAERRFIFNAQKVLTAEIEYFQKFSAACRALAAKQMSGLAMDSFLSKLFAAKEGEEMSTKAENQASQIKALMENGTGMDIAGVRGTAWAAYNAVTEYIDNFRPTRVYQRHRDLAARNAGL